MRDAPENLGGDLLWGGKSIASYLGCPLDKIPTLRAAGAPIRKLGGSLLSSKSALTTWTQTTIAGDRP